MEYVDVTINTGQFGAVAARDGYALAHASSVRDDSAFYIRGISLNVAKTNYHLMFSDAASSGAVQKCELIWVKK